MSSKAYRDWAIAQKRACSRRLKQAQAIKGRESSYWPTPTASMNGNKVDLELRPDTAIFTVRLGGVGKQTSVTESHRVWTRLWTWLKTMPEGPDALRSSPPVRLTSEDGGTSSLHMLDTNPLFLEALMGWPRSWTDTAQPVTEFAAWLQRSRGALSKLTSREIGRGD